MIYGVPILKPYEKIIILGRFESLFPGISPSPTPISSSMFALGIVLNILVSFVRHHGGITTVELAVKEGVTIMTFKASK